MTQPHHSLLKTALLTSLALVAFAANSILCRLALGTEAIDAAGFTVIRLVTGALVLLLILLLDVNMYVCVYIYIYIYDNDNDNSSNNDNNNNTRG